MLPVRDFLLIALFYTGTYSAPQNNQQFKGLKVSGSFYNHVRSPQNDQNFEGWTGDEFFNVRGETGLNTTPRNTQTFQNSRIGGIFYNDVPKTGNDQDFTGLKAVGGFIDANNNGPTQNGQNLRNGNVNDPRNIQTFRNAHIGGKVYNNVPNTGNAQDFAGLNAERGFIDANNQNHGPTQNGQNLRNGNVNDPRIFQTFRNVHIGGKFYNNVPKTGYTQDFTGLNAEGGFADLNNQNHGRTQNERNPRNQHESFINRQANRNFEDVTVGGDFYNVVRSGAVRDYPYVTHQNVRSTL